MPSISGNEKAFLLQPLVTTWESGLQDDVGSDSFFLKKSGNLDIYV